MEQKQLVSPGNLEFMLRPNMKSADFHTYNVFELSSTPGQQPKNYAFLVYNQNIHMHTPMVSSLRTGLSQATLVLTPTFKKLNFTPVAFVAILVQGGLTPHAYIDPRTREYDMRKHEDYSTKLERMSVREHIETSQIFTQLYKFILRDNRTNKIKPMPFYIPVVGYDNSFEKIATDKDITACFINALQKMR